MKQFPWIPFPERLKLTQTRAYQQCSRCILDTKDDPQMEFDANGVCHYCHNYEEIAASYPQGADAEQEIQRLVAQIKADGKNSDYDCVLGVSGGVDSTYLAFLSKEYGLRVLLVHFDNGWNSELAVKNIENIVEKTGYDLYTYVVDWNEFRDIQSAFLKAHVIDIEAITDVAIFTVIKKIAAEKNIAWALNGTNYTTEAPLPQGWTYKDRLNIIDIHKKYGKLQLKTLPLQNEFEEYYNTHVKKLQAFAPLNLVPYNKQEVKETIIREFQWRDYGGKHYESIFTRFYQGYILLNKFGVDKRKAHLSNLIWSGQLSREAALEALQAPVYDPAQLKEDTAFFLKKFDWTQQELDTYMAAPPRDHEEFDHWQPVWDRYPLLKIFRPLNRIMKKIMARK